MADDRVPEPALAECEAKCIHAVSGGVIHAADCPRYRQVRPVEGSPPVGNKVAALSSEAGHFEQPWCQDLDRPCDDPFGGSLCSCRLQPCGHLQGHKSPNPDTGTDPHDVAGSGHSESPLDAQTCQECGSSACCHDEEEWREASAYNYRRGWNDAKRDLLPLHEYQAFRAVIERLEAERDALRAVVDELSNICYDAISWAPNDDGTRDRLTARREEALND